MHQICNLIQHDQNRLGVLALTICAGLIAPQKANAEAFIMHGRCSELTAAGHNFTAACLGKAVNVTNDRGEVAFVFQASDGAIFSFVGDDELKANPQPDVALQPIKKLTFSLGIQGMPANDAPANGYCSYSNPFKGVATIDCVVTTSHGDFSAKFTTNGHPPDGY